MKFPARFIFILFKLGRYDEATERGEGEDEMLALFIGFYVRFAVR